MDTDGIRRLVDLKVDNITASIWAGDPKVYKRTHPGSPFNLFDRLQKNLSLLSEFRGQGARPKLKIYHVISSKNMDNIQAMVNFCLKVGADAIEFQLVDIVPGKTDSLRLTPTAREHILTQFKELQLRPDFTDEFSGSENFDDKLFVEELKEFGRIYPTLPEGFSHLPEFKAIKCPQGKISIEKQVTGENSFGRGFCVSFVFDQKDCQQCRQKSTCWAHNKNFGHLRLYPMEILGLGSFIRRLTSYREKKQEYERQIIDHLSCTIGWTYARVTVEGNVIPCCKAHKLPLGNLFDDSFLKIWQGPIYKEFRQKAKNLSKEDKYFDKIKCYKSCDNVGMNLYTQLRLKKYLNDK